MVLGPVCDVILVHPPVQFQVDFVSGDYDGQFLEVGPLFSLVRRKKKLRLLAVLRSRSSVLFGKEKEKAKVIKEEKKAKVIGSSPKSVLCSLWEEERKN